MSLEGELSDDLPADGSGWRYSDRDVESGSAKVSYLTGNCILCGSEMAECIHSGPDRLLGLPGDYQVMRCPICGLARTEPQIPVEARARYYAPEAGAGAGKARRIVLYQSRLAVRLDKALPSDGGRRVLDVGCGEGVFLALMRERGWQAVGVELGEESARIAREERGLDVRTGDLFSLDAEPSSFDAVVMSHVLEHLPDPVGALARVRELLEPGGMLMLSLPNYRCLESRVFRGNWFPWCLPPHLYHFDVRSVRMALERVGLEVVRITFLPFFYLPQSLRYVVRKATEVGRQSDSAKRDGARRQIADFTDILKTTVFGLSLAASSCFGRWMPGEVLEVEARKPHA